MPSSAALSFNFAIDQYSQQRDYIEQLGLEIDGKSILPDIVFKPVNLLCFYLHKF